MAVSVRARMNKPKIVKLVAQAMEELAQLALDQEATLWVVDRDLGTYVLNDAEYKRRFALHPTLENILKLLKSDGPIELSSLNDSFRVLPPRASHTEASKDSGIVYMTAIHLIHMFMDVEQWSMVFANIVSKAQVLEVLSTGELGSINGALQVMTAEFQISSPLVQTRETYFARHCRQLSNNTWIVVDVSLESIFPNPTARFIRKPSGCVIEEMRNGYSRVIWIEHVEVDYNTIHYLFRPLVTSGFAFCAKRWMGTLSRQCDRAAAFDYFNMLSNLSLLVVLVMQIHGRRRSLLKLADKMMRSYYAGVSTTTENAWKSIPLEGGEDIMVRTMLNEPETPGITIVVASTIWLPALPKDVFYFLRNGENRNQWDLLSLTSHTREVACLTTSLDPTNCVSIIETDKSSFIIYLQECRTNSTGSYVVYAPVDLFALNSVLTGDNPDRTKILASGFTILPDRPIMHGEEIGGTLLTIMFQIVDEEGSSPTYLPPRTIKTAFHLIKKTTSLIKTAVT
ncbi:hypothetical protein NMG60_11037224 [Bertholletia excelsa]